MNYEKLYHQLANEVLPIRAAMQEALDALEHCEAGDAKLILERALEPTITIGTGDNCSVSLGDPNPTYPLNVPPAKEFVHYDLSAVAQRWAEEEGRAAEEPALRAEAEEATPDPVALSLQTGDTNTPAREGESLEDLHLRHFGECYPPPEEATEV